MQLRQFIFLALLLTVSSPILFSQPEEPAPRIQVNGTATITLAPNELVLSIRIRHEDKKGSEAVSQYRKTRSQIIDTLKKYGLPDSTISESGMQFGTYIKRLQYNEDGEELFFAQSTFTASLFDFKNYPSLAVALTEIPGTFLEQSQFTNDSTTQIRHEARLQAVKEARKKAEAMAAVYGSKLGRPLLIKENYSDNQWNSVSNFNFRGGRGNESYVDPGLMVANDYLSVTASVYVEFELVE
ncbi:MAG: SIMPL domain-containing protein [Ignavibacteriae bacterium]|nr:SIMPL domain-containing protein [Ignavibacteriota bacterium]MCB9216206.1 SIMPL domain-containing protein [Ignavibacteria bacterium]